MAPVTTPELTRTTTNDGNTETTRETLNPDKTMIPTDMTTLPDNCTDLKPLQKCQRWADKIGKGVGGWFWEKCKKSLKKFLEKLSQKEVCNDDEMGQIESRIIVDDGSGMARMDSCEDEFPKRKCKRSLRKLNKRFNNLAKKCSKTAGELKKSLLMEEVGC